MSRPATEGRSRNPVVPAAAYRYGFLALILLFLAFNLWVFSRTPRPYKSDPYLGFIVPLMALFGHIAYAFPWRRRLRIAFGVVAWCWMAFGLSYLVFWSRVLFPLRY